MVGCEHANQRTNPNSVLGGTHRAVTGFTGETNQRWSDKCQPFLDKQRSTVLGTDPSPEVIAGRRTALRPLLTLAGAFKTINKVRKALKDQRQIEVFLAKTIGNSIGGHPGSNGAFAAGSVGFLKPLGIRTAAQGLPDTMGGKTDCMTGRAGTGRRKGRITVFGLGEPSQVSLKDTRVGRIGCR